jgi:predicted GNAT family N-acyltransferase
MNIVVYRHGDEPYTTDAHRVRDEVFIVEQEVDREEEFEFEEESIHYLLYDQEQPIATGRWRETDKGIKLERFAVLKKFRNRGLGGAVLQRILDDLKGRKEMLYLHAQLPAIPFYERYGFIKEGDEFIEAEIRHYRMTRPA